MKAHPDRDRVLQWAHDTGNLNAPAAVHAEFPHVSLGTIKSWLNRARADGRAPPLNLVSLPTPAPTPAAPVDPLDVQLDALAAQPLRDLVRLAMVRRIARLALPLNPKIESLADSAKILTSLADRVGIFESLEPVKELDPTTEEGRAALRAAVSAFPPETRAMLLEALAS